jgi:uncharacterized protein (TIGR02117 family)
MRRVLKWLALCALAVALIVVAGTLIPRPLFEPAQDAQTRRILVLSNPVHTDIAIPLTTDVRERFAFLGEAGIPIANPAAQWVVFGWGGRDFYLETPTWSDLKPRPVFKALTLDRSVMHIDVAGAIPEPHPAVTGFEISEAAFGRLVSFVEDSFEASNTGPIVIANRIRRDRPILRGEGQLQCSCRLQHMDGSSAPRSWPENGLVESDAEPARGIPEALQLTEFQSKAAPMRPDPTTEREILADVDAFFDHLANRRLEETLAAFGPEPALYGSEVGEVVIGHDALRRFFAKLFERSTGPRFTFADRRVSVGGDVAWFVADAEVRIGDVLFVPYRLACVLVRHDGRWLLSLFFGSEPAPARG